MILNLVSLCRCASEPPRTMEANVNDQCILDNKYTHSSFQLLHGYSNDASLGSCLNTGVVVLEGMCLFIQKMKANSDDHNFMHNTYM